jgi:hypothetical protein
MANDTNAHEIMTTLKARIDADPLSFLINTVVARFIPQEGSPAFRSFVDNMIELAHKRLKALGRPEEFADFIVAKNIKIFGGINEYVTDFFSINPEHGKDPINYALSLRYNEKRAKIIDSTKLILRKMLLQPGLTEENRARIEDAITRLNPPGVAAAAAAGGSRRRHRRHQTRRRR